MATEAKEFAHQALMQLRDSLSLSDAETARDSALALASAVKAWQTTRMEWRYAYGQAVPGPRRPIPEAPKVKAKKLNRPPPSLAPAKVVPDLAAQVAGTPQEPAT